MTMWTLGIFPASVNGENVLLHLWSNNIYWTSLVPPVLKNGDGANIKMYQSNNSILGTMRGTSVGNIAGEGNKCLVDLSQQTGSATLTITMTSDNSLGPVGGKQALDDSTWTWPVSTSLTTGAVYRFTVEVEVGGVLYKGDPEMVVSDGSNC